MSYNSPSIGDLLIATLGSARNTRQFYSIIRERELRRHKKDSIRVALSRLHKKGYVYNSSLGWSITKKGSKHLKDTRPLAYITSPFEKDSPATMIISFDIPEQNRTLRNWLRNQIKIFSSLDYLGDYND